MVYTLRFFFQNAVCFIILTYLVPVFFTFYIQGVLKLKKNISGAKKVRNCRWRTRYCLWCTSAIAVSQFLYRLYKPLWYQQVQAPRFHDSRHMKIVRLLALRTGHFHPTQDTTDINFCWRLSRPLGYIAAGRTKWKKHINTPFQSPNLTHHLSPRL